MENEFGEFLAVYIHNSLHTTETNQVYFSWNVIEIDKQLKNWIGVIVNKNVDKQLKHFNKILVKLFLSTCYRNRYR